MPERRNRQAAYKTLPTVAILLLAFTLALDIFIRIRQSERDADDRAMKDEAITKYLAAEEEIRKLRNILNLQLEKTIQAELKDRIGREAKAPESK